VVDVLPCDDPEKFAILVVEAVSRQSSYGKTAPRTNPNEDSWSAFRVSRIGGDADLIPLPRVWIIDIDAESSGDPCRACGFGHVDSLSHRHDTSCAPSAFAAKIHAKLDGSTYLPTIVPAGYSWSGWIDVSPSGPPTNVPSPATPWYELTYHHGSASVKWTVNLVTEPLRCSQGAAGHQATSRGTIDWSSAGSALTVWTCIDDTAGHYLQIVAAGPALSRQALVKFVASWTAG
jgi:hypothetical protein